VGLAEAHRHERRTSSLSARPSSDRPSSLSTLTGAARTSAVLRMSVRGVGDDVSRAQAV
jgi:hypothetical protein